MWRALISVLTFCLIVIILLPFLLVRGCDLGAPRRAVPGPTIRVYNHVTRQIMKLPLEDYLKGVVAAEMPAAFHIEALKAQAVTARTFAVKRLVAFGGEGCKAHSGSDICTDPNHCQAWISANEALARWGYINFFRYWRKISLAVDATRDLVITYQGELIDAVYHSNCGGATENSEDVWSVGKPYLVSVKCDFGQDAPNYRETKTFTFAQLERLLGTRMFSDRKISQTVAGKAISVIARERLDRPLSIVATTKTGRIKTIKVGTKVLSGEELRDALGLRSTRITWKVSGDRVHFTTTGYGHGVGMCQYGANGLARRGKNFEEIIKYYYKGVSLTEISRIGPEQISQDSPGQP